MSFTSRRESFSSSIASSVSRSSVLPTAFGGSTLATSEEARNSAADSAGVTFPGFAARSAGNVGVATPKLKSSGRSQKPRNSAAQRGESFIDSS